MFWGNATRGTVASLRNERQRGSFTIMVSASAPPSAVTPVAEQPKHEVGVAAVDCAIVGLVLALIPLLLSWGSLLGSWRLCSAPAGRHSEYGQRRDS